ncbi:MAG: hypothetical protein ACPGPS_10510 [Rubripirellula sp.]
MISGLLADESSNDESSNLVIWEIASDRVTAASQGNGRASEVGG